MWYLPCSSPLLTCTWHSSNHTKACPVLKLVHIDLDYDCIGQKMAQISALTPCCVSLYPDKSHQQKVTSGRGLSQSPVWDLAPMRLVVGSVYSWPPWWCGGHLRWWDTTGGRKHPFCVRGLSWTVAITNQTKIGIEQPDHDLKVNGEHGNSLHLAWRLGGEGLEKSTVQWISRHMGASVRCLRW